MDTKARERIRNSLDESLIVEAAAGTGKTSELVRRIVAVLQKGKTSVDKVVAVTFTRRAAGELKLRLRQELDRARAAVTGHSSQVIREKRNLENALARLEEARVGTIHAFCADILRERPVEARVDPAFEELSEEEAPRLYHQAFRTWVQEKLEQMPTGLRRALSRTTPWNYSDRSPLDGLRDAGWKLIEWRDFPAPWRRNPFDREQRIDGLIDDVLELADLSSTCRYQRDPLYQGLAPARALAGWMEGTLPHSTSPADYDSLEARLLNLLKGLKRHKYKKGTGGFAEGVSRQAVLDCREDLLEKLEEFQMAVNADLAALLREELWELVGRYEGLKHRAGRLDYVDLLIRVRDLLRHDADVRNYFQNRFTHIFVDEFQDTDPLQAEILLLLSSDGLRQNSWREIRPVAGKLFLVGDPKQSIYRFRRADVLFYQEVKEKLTSRGVGLVHLSTSFRALPNIQRMINAAFEPEMMGDRVTGQPQYVPLHEPDHQNTKAQKYQPSVVILPPPQPYGTFGITKEAVEACLPDTVAAFIDWLLHESGWKIQDPERPEQEIPVEERHLCVLFRRFLSWGRDITRDYVRALEVRGISHLLVGGKSFHHREEVETLRAALAAIEWPDDELSVFATLRGSLFSISDSILLRFRNTFGNLHPFRELPQPLDPDFESVAGALALLADFHRGRNRRPIVETVNELLEKTRSHAGFALRPAGNQALANLQRICDLARHFEISGGFSFRGFVEQLTTEAEKEETAEAPLLEEGAEGVRLMTVHAAKGLEFPIVILADITANLAREEPDRLVDAHSGLCAMRILGCSPWELLDHQGEEKSRDEAEGVRLAYVAATRARDLLVVPAVGDGNKKEWWLGSLNKAIYPHRKRWRVADKAHACPRFGNATVLVRPQHFDGKPEFSVRPGLHCFSDEKYDVVWWDPSVLQLNVEGNFGLRQEKLLAEDQGGEAAAEGIRQYQEWKDERTKTLQWGKRASFNVRTVTGPGGAVREPPPQRMKVTTDVVERLAGRTAGARFGTLVHTILRDVDLQGDTDKIMKLSEMHGRVLGASTEEIKTAVVAVSHALQHPVVERARATERCYRELPITLNVQSALIEGTIDLAFLEQGIWAVVDFKTDVHLEPVRQQYERQVEWYAYALSRITGVPAEGWLIGI